MADQHKLLSDLKARAVGTDADLYHRADGKVVKEGDDLMAATRYAIMSLRFASTKAAYSNFHRQIKYQTFCSYELFARLRGRCCDYVRTQAN